MELINKILSGFGLSGPRRYYGGNSGYVGYSKSKRAVAAEERGLRSKSQMDRAFANEVNRIIVDNGGTPISLKAIKDALPSITADEWHHTSMYGNKTDYYSAEKIADYFIINPTTKIKKSYSESDLEKEFDSLLDAKPPYIFKSTPYSNGAKIAIFKSYNGVELPYKGGFSLYPISENEPFDVQAAKAELNNHKKWLMSGWDKKKYVPSWISNDYSNPKYFNYKIR